MTIVHKLSDATPYATFWTGNQKLASNKNGAMVGFLTARDPNPAYNAQTIKIMWWDNDVCDAVEVGTIIAPTNPPSVLAASTGEFYVLIPDWVANTIRIWYWPDIKNSTVKQEFIYSNLVVGGKWSAVFDEGRRRFFIIGQSSGSIHFFNDECVYTGTINVFNPSINGKSLQYPIMQLCEANRLHIAYCTSDDTAGAANNAVTYRNIGYCWSPDLQNYASRFVPMIDWTSEWQTKPVVVDDNSPFGILRNEELWPNTLLTSMLVTNRHVHIVYGYVNKQSGKYVEDDGKGAKQSYIRFDRKTCKQVANTWPLCVDDKMPWFPATFLFERNNTVYHMYVDNMNICVAKWIEETDTWILVHTVELPSYATGGSFIHYLTGRLGHNTDNHVDALCTVVNSDYAGWGDGSAAFAPSKVMYIKIPLEDL